MAKKKKNFNIEENIKTNEAKTKYLLNRKNKGGKTTTKEPTAFKKLYTNAVPVVKNTKCSSNEPHQI